MSTTSNLWAYACGARKQEAGKQRSREARKRGMRKKKREGEEQKTRREEVKKDKWTKEATRENKK